MRSVLIETHDYRGFGLARDLLDFSATVGWVTVYLPKERVSDKLRRLIDELRKLGGDE